MRFIKYIFIFVIFTGLAMPLYSSTSDNGGKNSLKKSKFSKKGNFRKDDTFNKNGSRDFTNPPNPNEGLGNPLPVDPAYGLLILAGFSYAFFLLRKKKK
jgi:hypothetical protein